MRYNSIYNMKQTVIVSNRLPVSVKRGEKGIEVYPSDGGLATGLSTYANKKGNLWIGWPGLPSDDLTEQEKRTISELLSTYNCQPVFLTKKQIDEFYSGYSNSILWPFLHMLEPDFSHEDKQWKAYREVNQLFAEAALALSGERSTIWVHDYQLLLVPKLIHEQRASNDIGFFLHIPFPPAGHFTKLKEASSLIRGMLGADLVGFHTKTYAAHFLDSCYALTNAAPIADGVALKDRAIRVTDFPIGIDYVKFAGATKQLAVQRELKKLQKKYAGQKVVLTVDRLDPTKGFIERLDAYKTFLSESPQLHGKVTMLMLAVPSREDVKAYHDLKLEVDKRIRDINKTFGRGSWKPIVYMYKSVPFEYLSALYQLADVAFVAPIRDGMNLVAKEYVASQGDKKGILILSQSAGAAEELKDALLVTHENPRSLVAALKRAVKMPKKELDRRVAALQHATSANTIHGWAGEFLQTLKKPVPGTAVPNLTPLRRDNLVRNFQGATRRLLLLDYDGVLAPFVDQPRDASPSDQTIAALSRIAKLPNTDVAIISGRSRHDLVQWLGDLPLTLIAEHGSEARIKGQGWTNLVETPSDWKAIIKPSLIKHAQVTPGALVEEKDHSLVWHYRGASPYYAQKNVAILRSALKTELRQLGLKLYMGNKILEIKNPAITKGKATKKLLTKPYDFIMALGDDFTDEDMFAALPKRAYTLKVGPGKTSARYRIKNVAEVQNLLRSL